MFCIDADRGNSLEITTYHSGTTCSENGCPGHKLEVFVKKNELDIDVDNLNVASIPLDFIPDLIILMSTLYGVSQRR